MSDFDTLASAPYISFATFRKSGARVATPMWCARYDGHLYIITAPDTGKIKRLRNSSRAQVALCNFKGDVSGDWIDAEANFVSEKAEVKAALRELRRKYGWQMHLADLGAKLIGRFWRRIYIRIEPVSGK